MRRHEHNFFVQNFAVVNFNVNDFVGALNRHDDSITAYFEAEGREDRDSSDAYLAQGEEIFSTMILPQLMIIEEEFNSFPNELKNRLNVKIQNFFNDVDACFWTFEPPDANDEERSAFYKRYNLGTGQVVFSSRTGGDDPDDSEEYTVGELLQAIRNNELPRMPLAEDLPMEP